MASNKLARTNDDIQRVLSGLLTQVKDPRVQQGMISVTRVETTGDLRYAKVWLSVLGLKMKRNSARGCAPRPAGCAVSLARGSRCATPRSLCLRWITRSSRALISAA